MFAYGLALVLGYLLGSLPFGVILTRLAGTADLRTIGSGNIGATNVLRTGRRDLAALTLLFDVLKGTLAVVLGAVLVSHEVGVVAGVGAFLGHLFPVWLGFKGGKGVATYLGVLLSIDWRAALAFAVVWLGVAAALRYSSLAALTASLVPPVFLFFTGHPFAAGAALIMVALLWCKHAPNISRLLAGTETRIGQKG
ncbi:MAG: glycerol-3-phosphate 1-O-acyltransferase PlsY [Bauldia sp.]|nr:glycerol-3-phosphate 1-O-acyltransferase PlsY [Bauldia sp.]